MKRMGQQNCKKLNLPLKLDKIDKIYYVLGPCDP